MDTFDKFESFSFDTSKTAVVVNLKLPEVSELDNELSVQEFNMLAKTLGVDVKATFVQKRHKVEPAYYIGKGKLEEIKEYVQEHKIETVLFDNELTGVQARNLEKYFDIPIFGRTEVILNIFDRNARTHDAKLQVKLASLEYMLPRLKNRWDHFSRVEGGIGMRGGEGEKQLELDRRMIQDHINRIKKKLKKVDTQMKTRRKSRLDSNLVSLVGYTNAGKTSLMNLLSKKELLSKNMLFSTLDSNVKKVFIDHELTILLHDTVGFINKLPHSLVASFKSTLDEIKSSKLLLHVIDSSSPYIHTQISSVNSVIAELNATDVPKIRVFNKSDLLENGRFDILADVTDDDILISTMTGEGIEELKERIKLFFEENYSHNLTRYETYEH